MISTQDDDRHGLVEKIISQHRDKVRGPLDRELGQIAEDAAQGGRLASSGHIQQRLDLFVAKIRSMTAGVLESFLEVIDRPEDVTVDEIHETLEREADAICRLAQEDIQKWAAQFGPQGWLEKLRDARTRALSDGRRDIEVALGRMKRAAKRQVASTPDSEIKELAIPTEPAGDNPVAEAIKFQFIRDEGLHQLLERDYQEIQRALGARCWKSVIILSGGAIEAILTDLLLVNESAAKAAQSAPKKSDITKWDLADLIDVAVELKLIAPGVSKLSHPVREYRNLIHPGNEIRNKLSFGPEEARIAIEVLRMLHRDLSR